MVTTSVSVVTLVPVVPFRWFRWFRWFRSGGYAGSGGSVPVVSFRCSWFYHMPKFCIDFSLNGTSKNTFSGTRLLLFTFGIKLMFCNRTPCNVTAERQKVRTLQKYKFVFGSVFLLIQPGFK